MSRKQALLRLHQRLIAQRDELRKKIADDLGLAYSPDDGINDLGETAHQVEQTELHTQLAALESRELRSIEHAIAMIRQGRYGQCEGCQKPIPIARLQALPFSLYCVECQRKAEVEGMYQAESESNWASAMEFERRSSDRELSLSDLDQGGGPEY
jgi:DnaK suppressor protein